jgi:hypothetical protein
MVVSMNEICSADDDARDEVSVILIVLILVVLEIGFVSEIN